MHIYRLIFLLFLLMTSCVQISRDDDLEYYSMHIAAENPFSTNYQSLIYPATGLEDIQVKKEPFLIIIESLKEKGYTLIFNNETKTGYTTSKDLGKQRWVNNGEKWEVSYQIGFQVIKSQVKTNLIYWRLTYQIEGTRPGREPRLFNPSDFEETISIFNSLESFISNRLNSLYNKIIPN